MFDTPTDQTIDFSDVDDDVAAFVTSLTGVERPKDDPEAPQETAGADAQEQTEEGAGPTAEAPSEEAPKEGDAPITADPDDSEIVVKVGTEERRMRLSELSDMVAQRESLEARTKQVAETTSQLQQKANEASVVYAKMLERAQAKLRPYENMDWITLRRDLGDAEWNALRGMAEEAVNEVKFLKEESAQVLSAAQQATSMQTQERAKAALEVLTGPEDRGGIPDFGPKLYNEMLEWGAKAGLNPETLRAQVDPAAIRILHKAMLWEQSQAKAQDAGERIKRATVKPTSVARPAQRGTPQASSDSQKDALMRLRKTGTMDDAEAAFLASFKGADD